MSNGDQLGLVGGSTIEVGTRRSDETSVGQAVVLLEWDGLIVENMLLFGHSVTVVAVVDQQAHEARLAEGWGPVTDRMSVALWGEWPEHAVVPPPVMSLTGFIARSPRWQRALAIASGFVGFGSTAILLDQDHEPNEHCLIAAHLRGIAVLRSGRSSGDAALVRPGRTGPVPTARPTVVSRWVEELVYERFVGSDCFMVSGVE
ncbi:hypothetical protein [Actinosynnema sp. ALI-1.44]|uniref:hypothetical protein n=1 Tax=Actinosynnema sp. ALI-1.44 TaxID=1933779 RepID=UPI001177A4FB|nr:hypothetical protein [Actinosynnema sp. ALI-1.44]